MVRKEVLETALSCVDGGREQDYGKPEDNFGTIASLWSTYLGYPVTSKDVAAMMILEKISRIMSGHAKDDNWVDIAGYAACGGEIESTVTITKNGESK